MPAVSGDHLLGELLDEWPIYLGYFLAFMMIGVRWIEHSEFVDALAFVDEVFLRINLVLMLLVAFLPYPTRLMAEFAGDPAGERVAVVFFGVVLMLQSLTLWVLVRHADRHGLYGADAEGEKSEDARVRYQIAPSLVFYGVASVVGLLRPQLAVFLYLVIALPRRAVRVGEHSAHARQDAVTGQRH